MKILRVLWIVFALLLLSGCAAAQIMAEPLRGLGSAADVDLPAQNDQEDLGSARSPDHGQWSCAGDGRSG